MPRTRLSVGALLTLLLVWTVCQAGPAVAANFSVHPIRLVFAPETRSSILRLTNQSPEPLRLQLSLFAWDQRPDGEMQLSPTEDLVFFPTLLTLGPGESRNIRVGPATPFAAIEKTYRVFVEELPPLASAEGGPGGVRVLTRIGIPIFLQPAQVIQRGHIGSLTVRQGTLSFEVHNTGNVHFIEQAVRITGFGPAKDSLFDREVAGWYVLTGGFRTHRVDLPKDTCAKIRVLAVAVHTESGTFQERLDIPPGACHQ
jgi:fimbrial chaperone protein